MRDDDATLADRQFENVYIRPASELLFVGGANVAAARPKAFDHVWSDVVVGKKREVERFHAVILSSQVCSPLSTSAAYRKAAARPPCVT